MPKPHIIDRQALRGKYRSLLGSVAGAGELKRLWHVLDIDEEGDHASLFSVEFGDEVHVTDSLVDAVALYNDGPPKTRVTIPDIRKHVLRTSLRALGYADAVTAEHSGRVYLWKSRDTQDDTEEDVADLSLAPTVIEKALAGKVTFLERTEDGVTVRCYSYRPDDVREWLAAEEKG